MTDRAIGQVLDDAAVDDLPRALVEGDVQREDLAPRGELRQRGGVRDPELRGPRRRERSAPAGHVEPERARPRRDLASDGAETRDAEGLALEPLGLAVLLPLPFAAAQRRDGVGDPAIERDDEPEDELGDRGGVAPRAVGDVDAPPARRADVDRGELGARAHDEVELLGALDRRGGHFGRSHDQDPDAGEPRLPGSRASARARRRPRGAACEALRSHAGEACPR